MASVIFNAENILEIQSQKPSHFWILELIGTLKVQ